MDHGHSESSSGMCQQLIVSRVDVSLDAILTETHLCLENLSSSVCTVVSLHCRLMFWAAHCYSLQHPEAKRIYIVVVVVVLIVVVVVLVILITGVPYWMAVGVILRSRVVRKY